MSRDFIEIKDLLVRGVIGVHEWERHIRQDILVNIRIAADLRAAGAADDLDHSVNYRTIAKQVIEHVETIARKTIEALATDIAQLCCAMPGCVRVWVRVEKPGAVRFAKSVGVEIEREPADFA